MKESYREGVATHPDPESCGGGGNTSAEALTGAHTGGLLSSEITISTCRPSGLQGKVTWYAATTRVASQRGGVEEPWHVWKLHAREPGDPVNAPLAAGPGGKGHGRNPTAYVIRESDRTIVPMKRANKARSAAWSRYCDTRKRKGE